VLTNEEDRFNYGTKFFKAIDNYVTTRFSLKFNEEQTRVSVDMFVKIQEPIYLNDTRYGTSNLRPRG
jgi:hypothetical protein